MDTERTQSPRASGIRSGLELLAVSALLVPVMFMLEGLPSIENSNLDELPHSLVAIASMVLAVAGAARICHALIVHRAERTGRSVAGTRTDPQLQAPRPRDMMRPQSPEPSVSLRKLHDTPV